MGWPEVPTCHRDAIDRSIFKVPVTAWQLRDDGLRHCNYCGSLHPEDFLRLMDHGVHVGGSDWKYGWPHKFYVTTDSKPGAPGLFAKWYNEHLQDEGYGDVEMAKLLLMIEHHAGIQFYFKDGPSPAQPKTLAYRAPYFGYQR